MFYSEMGLLKLPLVVLLRSVFSLLSFLALCAASELTVKFLKTPHDFSNLNSTTFVFEVLVGGSGACTNCNITCKLDDDFGRINASQCENGTVLCEGLQDGNHKFEVCPNGTQGVGCSSYNWTVDTVPPTANISASTPFTNALNVSINISFSEPCTGGGGFACSSVNACNLLVNDAGQVIPTSLKTLQPNLQYSVLVSLSSTAQYGRVILVMDKNFCTDSAGNKFERNKNSTFTLHFDRRSINFTTHVPERHLQFNGETRLVRATNNCTKLRICLTFPVPVLNSSEEIKNSLKLEILYSHPMNTVLPLVLSKTNPGHSRFEFKVAACKFDTVVVTISIDSNSIISRQGIPFSPVEPLTFIYDSRRPAVNLITQPIEFSRPAVMLHTSSHTWTRERIIPVLIKFVKPVFGFDSSNILITGGQLHRFKEVSNGIYTIVIKADQDIVSINVPGNVIGDVAGNKNRPSNVLQVMHYSVPKISTAFSGSIIGSIVVILIAAGLLKVSIASFHSTGESPSLFPSLSQPKSNLFRIACHLQVIALSGWLAVRLPVEYYELTRGLRWSIPYLSLPWERETGRTRLVMGNSSLPVNIQTSRLQKSDFIKPLLALVGKDHESPAETEHLEFALDPSGWRAFGRNMFWLAIIGGGFINVHALLLLILYLKKKNPKEQRDDGVLKKNSEEQSDDGVLKKNSEEQSDDGVLEKNSDEQRDGGVLKKNSEEQSDDGVLEKNSEEQRDNGVLKKNSEEQRDGGVLKKNSEEQSDDGVLKKNSEEQRDNGVLEKNSEEQSDDGVLTSPRFEIIIVNLGITSICQASAAIIRGGTASGIAVGVLLLGVVSFILLAWLLFLYKGITRAHLLEYEEVHQEEQDSHCYKKIVRAFLVLVKEPKWKPTDQQKSNYLPILGSLYEEFRGPPTSKLSQNSGGSSHTQAEATLSVIQKPTSKLSQNSGGSSHTQAEAPLSVIQKPTSKLSQNSGGSSHTQAEAPLSVIQKPTSKLSQNSGGSSHTQAEAPLSVIQKLCGELRIYYPLLESVRRVLLGIMAGLYEEDKSLSKIPTTFSLCINCFHLFFLVLEKPFIENNIQVLEIIAVSSEVCISAIVFVLGEKKLSDKDGKKFGILMLILVLVGNLPLILNELYALYKQIKQLDIKKHFLPGLKKASKEFAFRLKGVFIKQPSTSASTSTSYQVKSPNQD